MSKLKWIIVGMVACFSTLAYATPTNDELDARLKVLEKIAGVNQPTTQPVPVPVPTPVPGPITAKPVQLPPITQTVQVNNQMSVGATVDGTGKKYQMGQNGRIVLYGNLFKNAEVQTLPGVKQGQVFLTSNNATLDSIRFTDPGGFLMEASGKNHKILNVSAQTFSDYGLFCTDADGILIDGLYIKGGSQSQSMVRFASNTLNFSSGILRNFVLDYTLNTGSAALRGNFAGVIENGYIHNRVVGLNPQDNDDEGMAHGIYIWVANVPGGAKKASNPTICIAAAKLAISQGITDQTKISQACLAVARDENNKTIPGNISATITARTHLLARRSDIVFRNITLDSAPLRWAAGCKYDFHSGSIIGGTLFDKPTKVYPTDELLLPGDARRPDPDITFTDTKFVTTKTKDEFIAMAKSMGFKVRSCTFNGSAIADIN